MDDEPLAKVVSPHFTLTIDKMGRIGHVALRGEKFESNGKPLELFQTVGLKPLEIHFKNKGIDKLAKVTPYEIIGMEEGETLNLGNGDREITLRQNLSDLVLTKKIIFHENLSFDVELNLNRDESYLISNGMRPDVDIKSYAFRGVLIKEADDTLNKIEDGKADKNQRLILDNTKFIASVDRYFTTLLYADEGLRVEVDSSANKDALPFVSLEGSAKLKGYIGPKDFKVLKNINPTLTSVIEYGFITFFAKPIFLLLAYLNSIFSNWGWAIIALTAIVRLVLYPLTYKGMVSMQKLKELAPELKEIQQKYKGDAQKTQIHIMELYKKNKANPLGGCLPLLMQIPVFFAIYRVLYNAVELKSSAWLLWIKDLSVMDPYFILPLLMGGSMYLQQTITPSTFTDPIQEKIFKFLPVIFTIFLISFPAGLILYWTINNIFSITQQLIINKILKNKKKSNEKN